MGLYWLAFFISSRIIFLLYHFSQTKTLLATDIFTINLLGLRMDLAMAGYWLILPGLLLTASVFVNNRIIYYLNNIVAVALLLLSVSVIVADLELYKHWGFRMDTTPLMYARAEGVASVNSNSLIVLVTIFTVLLASFLWIYFRKIANGFLHLPLVHYSWAMAMFLITGALIIPIRSGFGVAPLNTGVVYFHKTKVFPNHAGINAVWNFLLSVVSNKSHRYPKDFYDPVEAETLLTEMENSAIDSVSFLNTGRPNIILIVMESFTAKIIKPLGGLDSITPSINKLVHEGVLFDNFYASGDRTDKGIVSILSAYPAQPVTSIIKYPSKTQSLPFLPRAINSLGYHSSFVYGGDIGFANMESYVTTAGFSHITEDEDFDNSLDNSKWGVQDQFVFDRLLGECDTAVGPFFKVMLSLSSHEPFDVPMEPVIKGQDEGSLFLNSCIYADRSLGNFIEQAKQKPWWTTTWIIITADHGHRHPNQEELKEKERFKIPMLWIGGAVNKQDTVINTYAGQTDIAKTLLSQLSADGSQFRFSKDILSKNVKPFATYIFHNGYGYIDPQNEFIYDFDFNKLIKQSGDEEDLKWSKAYMQVLFTDYNKR